MGMTTITSREFNQDASGAKRKALRGPVFITDRGRPGHVLLTIEDYRRIQGKRQSVAESLAQTGADSDFDFDFEEFKNREVAKPFEFESD